MKLADRVKRLEGNERSGVVCILLRPGETVEQYQERTGTRFEPGEIVVPCSELDADL